MGGIALGKGVSSSGLLGIVGDGIRGLMGGLSLPAVVLLLTLVVLVNVPNDPRVSILTSDAGYLDLHQPYDC